MELNDQQTNLRFSSSGAWLGLIAYIVLVLIIGVIFIWG